MILEEFFEPILLERSQDIGDALKYYAELPGEQYFFTYTEKSKVGINPRSLYDTPLGVYAYPLTEMYESVKNDNVPFASTRPNVYLLKARAHVTDLEEINEQTYNKIFEQVCDQYKELIIDPIINVGPSPRPRPGSNIKYMKAREELSYQKAKDTLRTMVRTQAQHFSSENVHAAQFWTLTRLVAHELHRTKKQRISTAWNVVLRQLGFDAISDRHGYGIIHSNEPIQAVFLTSRAFEVVEVFPNVRKERIQLNDEPIVFDTVSQMVNYMFHYCNSHIDAYDDEGMSKKDITLRQQKSHYLRQIMKTEWRQLLETGQSEHFELRNKEEFWQELLGGDIQSNLIGGRAFGGWIRVTGWSGGLAAQIAGNWFGSIVQLIDMIERHPKLGEADPNGPKNENVWSVIATAIQYGKLSRADIQILLTPWIREKIEPFLSEGRLARAFKRQHPGVSFYGELLVSRAIESGQRRGRRTPHSLHKIASWFGPSYHELTKIISPKQIEEINKDGSWIDYAKIPW